MLIQVCYHTILSMNYLCPIANFLIYKSLVLKRHLLKVKLISGQHTLISHREHEALQLGSHDWLYNGHEVDSCLERAAKVHAGKGCKRIKSP